MSDDELIEIGKEIATQDNMATAHPIFILFNWEQIPTKEDWARSSEDYYYLDHYECEEIGKTKEEMINYIGNSDFLTDEIRGLDPDEIMEKANEYGWNWEKIFYIEFKEYKNTFFTRKALEKHLESNRHHYDKPFIYCACLWRNPEMQKIRNYLMNLETTPATQEPIKEKEEDE